MCVRVCACVCVSECACECVSECACECEWSRVTMHIGKSENVCGDQFSPTLMSSGHQSQLVRYVQQAL